MFWPDQTDHSGTVLRPVAPASVGRGRSELQSVLVLLAVAVAIAFHD